VRARFSGVVLFLPVPVVLALFTRLPLGALTSLGFGSFLTVTHALYARPFSLSRAPFRCLLCGGEAGEGPALSIREPFGETAWRCCREDHALRLRSILGWAGAHSLLLKIGIVGSIGLFLPGVALAARGALGPVTTADVIAGFRLAIALTVLPFGLLSPLSPPREGPLKVPFPLHIQALIGTEAVLWLFRVVGVLWLWWGATHFLNRALA
jgi:hypothetical protein